MGWERWPAYLQGFLGRPVINAANGGWGVDQIVLRTEQLLDALEPKIVVMGFSAGSIYDNRFSVYGGANKPYFLVRDGKLVHMNNPVPPFRENAGHGIYKVLGYSRAAFFITRRGGYTQLQ